MIKLKTKNYITILTEKQQKYQHYHQVKKINRNILQAKKYCHLIKVKQQNKLSLYIILSGNHLKNTKRH